MCWVVIAGKSDSRQLVTNVSLRRKRDDSRSTRGDANICQEQERRESGKGEKWLM